ncbi:MAG TPA: glycoside hydrolase family 3 C-terminal domain-containing protein [Terracidiphilus sp.]|nr:glycoside hydrolase family 3 C-terminal domain-containing protein [Terracidiphilus sp.]
MRYPLAVMKNLDNRFPKALLSFISGILPLAFACVLLTVVVQAQAPAPDSPAIEAQAHAMLSKLTLQQKIDLLGGEDGMYTHPMPSIDLPRFKMSDASVGVRTWGPTTAYAGGVALAATWDPTFARKLGQSLGKDARARDVNFLLGPGVNIARAPVGGRNFEYLSEDPYLNGDLDVPFIEGVQSEGVAATVKHYALNNEEFNRHNASSDIDERTMREIYLPGFEAAVTKGHVDAVMNSYNLINGVHATQNPVINLQILKGDWGFKGVLMSDWAATYDGVAAANNGLDLEMPSPRFMNEQTLVPAVHDGRVKESTIDDKVLRLLRVELRYGWTKRPQFDPADSTYSVADRAVALQGALESITLLKNEDHLLPLDPARIKTIAIVGPDAWPAVPGGGGSSHATAFDPVSTVTGIANFLGPNVHVLYSRGLPEMQDVFRQTHWQGDVKIESFPDADFSGEPQTTNAGSIAAMGPMMMRGRPGAAQHSIRYTTSFKADQAGPYLLLASGGRADSFKVLIDGKQQLEQPAAEGEVPQSATINLTAGQTVSVEADVVSPFAGAGFSLGMAYAPSLVSDDAKKFASIADVVVVCAGFDAETEGEGHDRTFKLPWGQDALIEAMAAANPHTIVTLTGGGGMETAPWLDKVPVLLHTWYPGQEGGTAVAEILFGKHDPEGKLPVTFDRSWPDSASYDWYYPKGPDTPLHEAAPDGKPIDYTIQHIQYGDKLMVGYRYWTTMHKQPLFPFGFGLSYTTFRFSNLHAPSTAAADAEVPVSFDVTNTGKVDGAEVAQLYVSDPSAKVDRPERELKGFEKVRLAPGETRNVTLTLDPRSFSYWNEAQHKWTIDPGKFIIRVGDSSENTPLDASLTMK